MTSQTNEAYSVLVWNYIKNERYKTETPDDVKRALVVLDPRRAQLTFSQHDDTGGLGILLENSELDKESRRLIELDIASIRQNPLYEMMRAKEMAEAKDAPTFSGTSCIPLPRVDRTGEEMNPWQENAYRVLEEIVG